MSYSYGACSADIIDKNDIKKLCTKEYKTFMKSVSNAKKDFDFDTFDEFCQYMYYDYNYDVASEKKDTDLIKAWSALQKAFKKATGFTLIIEYISGDTIEINDGPLDYDTAGYFSVKEGFLKMTPRAKKLLEKCTHSGRAYWVAGG